MRRLRALARWRRAPLWLLAAVLSGCEAPSTTETGTLMVTQPSVTSATPIPADFVWSTPADLGAWANNVVSRNVSLLAEDGVTFIRARLGPDSFTLRSPDLPQDAAPITGIRIVYRWQPSDSRHALNVSLAIAVPWEKRYAEDKALLALGLEATAWTGASAGPTNSPGLPFVAQYVYFTAEPTVTPGLLDIRTIAIVR